MQVILLERVEKLGQMGQVVTVKPGYARNFLLPKKKALRATKENLVHFEQQKAQLEARNLKLREEAVYVANQIKGKHVVLVRQASEMGALYGSVSAQNIKDQLVTLGFTIDRGQIEIHAPIKKLGIHAVKVILHPEVREELLVNVGRTEEEAANQMSKYSDSSSKGDYIPENIQE